MPVSRRFAMVAGGVLGALGILAVPGVCGQASPQGTKASSGSTIVSLRMDADVAPAADPAAPHWRDVPPVLLDRDFLGTPIPGRLTEVRSRWTPTHLYLLYSCPYDTLTLRPELDTVNETPQLWNWDVAEAFIGWDERTITRYKEFQVSPRGEWVDLDIDRADQKNQAGMAWDSGFEVAARIDEQARIWYGEMRIPFGAIDPRGAAAGRTLRVGLYRIAGAEPRTYYAWQPTGARNFHVPEAFGTLRLQ